jgi:hypothetical protein
MKFIISLCWLLSASFLYGAVSAGEGMVTMDDTLVFDLSQASFSNDGDLFYIEFPVIIESTDPSINAVDFWYQFNLEKMAYVSTTSLVSVLDVFSNYNQNNQYLSNTSSTTSNMVYLPLGVPIMKLKFSLTDPCSNILDSEFYTPTALVNGIVSSSVFIAAGVDELQPIEILTPEPFCAAHDVEFTYDAQVNGQAVATYNWDFGNGLTGSTQTDTTTYHVGPYTITLDILTEAGCAYSVDTTLEVMPSPLVDFTTSYNPDLNVVYFTNLTTISNGSDVTFFWEFGDGQTSDLFSPTHSYDVEGYYNVTLTAYSEAGCSSSVTHFIASTTGVEDMAGTGYVITIFPNPSSTEFTLRSSKALQFYIVDNIGQHVTELQTVAPDQNLHIPVTSLADGLYTLVGYDEHGQYQERFIVQHP